MATVGIRYIVDDVDAAIDFYRRHLGFSEVMHPAPTFAMLVRGDLRLALSAPGAGPGGGGRPMPDGALPRPGGWNRFTVEVDDLERAVAGLRAAGVHMRNDIVAGVGGKQILIDDPSGNPIELFEPTRPEARLTAPADPGEPAGGHRVHPIGRVESALIDPARAPKQGGEGAPDAWLVIDRDLREGLRGLEAGADILVLTWLHRSRRDELVTHPRGDRTRPEQGVFSTRSPARPNPIGLHRVTVLEVSDSRLRVGPLEAIDGTPIVDIKPVIAGDGR